ncbi:lantibiotic dehydratase C-terminal domain-containing protein [Streptomyces sp. NRRL F-2580]|uniref:lantibiotic dehydratase C-terminal domain-containing protein n=1 Tax=Streptomyces sp. NRRL F-2580 TaxID=1463841 RepID=UPI0004C5B4D4|nr:lantibiotic dehydratase C-terminal domain-containing protein [Streptomyces sp. NRRL F-2580]
MPSPDPRAPAGAHPRDSGALDVVAYYHHPVKAPLLREVMLPLAADAAADGTAAHVERHWLHGPHLRLRLQGTDPAQVADTAATAAGRIRAWLRAHPSHSDLTEAQLLQRAAEAGRAELIPPPYEPLLPDNTVRTEPVDRSSVRGLLGADGTALREDLLRSGLDALRAGAGFLGRHGDTGRARLRLAVTALAAHACAHPGGLTGGHWSYVSHLEDFLLHDDPDGRLRATFERHGEQAEDTVTALVGRIADGRADDWEQAWAGFSQGAWRLTQERYDAGADLHGDPLAYRVRAAATGDAAAHERWNQDIRTRYSEFHRLLRRADPQGAMWSRPDYLVHRACTNALYRLLAVCDVRPLERYLAAHLVVRAVPALTGCDWRTEMGAVIDAVEART